MDEEARVYFGVFNFDADPQSVTDAIGLQPHQSWRTGESGPHRSRRTHDRWEFRAPTCAAAPFEVQLDELLSILEARRDRVRQVVESFEAGICCTAKYRDTVNPGFHLSQDVVRRLADLGMSIDFDLFVLGGPDGS